MSDRTEWRVDVLETQVERLESKVVQLTDALTENTIAMAALTEKIAVRNAGASHETLKQIGTVLGAALLAFGGAVGYQKASAPPDVPAPTVVHRSAFEIELTEGCARLEGEAKAQCTTRAIERATRR